MRFRNSVITLVSRKSHGLNALIHAGFRRLPYGSPVPQECVFPERDFPPRTLVHSASAPKSPTPAVVLQLEFAEPIQQLCRSEARGTPSDVPAPAHTTAEEWSH